MTTPAAQALIDDELSGAPEDAIQTAIRERLKDLHVAMPGIIQSFDAAKQTAVVKPAIKRLWVDDGALDLPPCQDVPVVSMRGGNFALTMPVAAGDECLLVFSERAIDNWFSSGGSQEPSEYRLHDLSDAFAIVGVSSLPRAIANLATDAAELRTLDGATVFRLEDAVATVGDPETAERMLLGESTLDQLVAVTTSLQTFLTTLSSTCTGVTTLAQAMAAINAIGPAADTALPALSTFLSNAQALLAKKAKAG